jgi:hypothetical protein
MNDPNVYIKSLLTMQAFAAFFILIAIPLIKHKIPRNGLYGFRTKTTLSCDEIWYPANAYFGRSFAIANVVTILAMTVLYLIRDLVPLMYFIRLSLATLVVPSTFAAIMTFRCIHLLKKKQRAGMN